MHKIVNYHYGFKVGDISCIFKQVGQRIPSIIHQMIHCIKESSWNKLIIQIKILYV